MSGVMKRSDLRCGKDYVIFHRSHIKIPGSGRALTYRRVHLVDLLSGNRAVVVWREQSWASDKMPRLLKDGVLIHRSRTMIISCSQFLATTAEWDEYGSVYDIHKKHLVLTPVGSQMEMV